MASDNVSALVKVEGKGKGCVEEQGTWSSVHAEASYTQTRKPEGQPTMVSRTK